MARSFAIFLAVALSILGGMHYYFWVRLVRDPGLADPWRKLATAAIVLLAIAFPVAMFTFRRSPAASSGILPAIGFGWLGAAFLLLVALVFLDLGRLAVKVSELVAGWFRGGPSAPPDPARRVFVAQAVAGAALTAATVTSAFAVRRAGGPAETPEVPVRMEKLPRALDGYTIAQISDLHVGPTIREKEVRRVVEQTNGLRPDLVAITGDLMDGGVRELGPILESLKDLRARHGVVFITGNHEYYSGVGEWLPWLRKLGVRVLENERMTIGDAGGSFELAGVNDVMHDMDLGKALAGRDPEKALVLLAHQPRGIEDAVRAGVDLQLSGHTHGGQIVPFNLLVGFAQPYVRGLHRHVEGERAGHIYVSRGTGYWGPPMRLGAPPEIAKIVLTSAPGIG
ncbi:MAG: metallophosphoesterase [Anaeromyxobacter sp.]